MRIGRRGALGLLAAAIPGMAEAAYPDRPVRLVVPFTPGGSVDLMARAFGRALGDELAQPIVVENRPGATTSIGAAYVARAEADGYMLLSGGTNVGLNKLLIRSLPYDPDRDLVAVSLLTIVPYLLVLNPDLPARSLPELIAHARANPGKLTYASFGVGGAGHIAGEMFNGMTGADMVHIPYNGTAPGLADVMAGRVSLSFCTIPPALPLIQAGRLRPIALTGQQHLPALPGIPTLHEAGLPGFEAARGFDFGDAGYIAKVPDIGEDPSFDF